MGYVPRWKRKPSALPEHRPAQVALVLREMLRRTEDASRRSESMSSRAGILIASAALTAALQEGREADGWLVAAIVLSLVAAGLGVAAIFPRKMNFPDVMTARTELYRRGNIADAEWWLADRLAEQYATAARYLEFRGRILRVGFLVLVVSIFAMAMSIIIEFRGR